MCIFYLLSQLVYIIHTQVGKYQHVLSSHENMEKGILLNTDLYIRMFNQDKAKIVSNNVCLLFIVEK